MKEELRRLPSGPGRALLRLLCTTDLHMRALSWDYLADRRSPETGLSRAASMIAACRRQVPNVLLFDNGDFLDDSLLGEFAGPEAGGGLGWALPMIRAMNTTGYDAGTLGNHELDLGTDALARLRAAARFPIALANVLIRKGRTPEEDEFLFAPRIVLRRWLRDGAGARLPVSVGVLGLAPPPSAFGGGPERLAADEYPGAGLSEDPAPGLAARGMVEAARHHARALRAAGADLVVALCHAGITDRRTGSAGHGGGERLAEEESARAVAAVPGVDVVIAGHVHQTFPDSGLAGVEGVDPEAGTLFGKPAVMAGAMGSHLGLIDLDLLHEGGRWRVLGSCSEALPVARRGADGSLVSLVSEWPPLMRAVAPHHRHTRRRMRQVIGRSAAPIRTHFALATENPGLELVAEAMRAHVRGALKGRREASLPVLAAVAPYRAGGAGGPSNFTDIPAGPLTLRALADLCPHADNMAALRITGARIVDWLERSASVFRQVPPGSRDATLLDPAFASYDFEILSGLTYRIDLSQPARFSPSGELVAPHARRVTQVRHRGRPVVPDEAFVVAIGSHRARRGLRGTPPGRLVHLAPRTIRQVLRAHIAAADTVVPSLRGTWAFLPMPGTTVVLETAPEAAMHLDEAGHPAEVIGPSPSGLLRVRLHL